MAVRDFGFAILGFVLAYFLPIRTFFFQRKLRVEESNDNAFMEIFDTVNRVGWIPISERSASDEGELDAALTKLLSFGEPWIAQSKACLRKEPITNARNYQELIKLDRLLIKELKQRLHK